MLNINHDQYYRSHWVSWTSPLIPELTEKKRPDQNPGKGPASTPVVPRVGYEGRGKVQLTEGKVHTTCPHVTGQKDVLNPQERARTCTTLHHTATGVTTTHGNPVGKNPGGARCSSPSGLK